MSALEDCSRPTEVSRLQEAAEQCMAAEPTELMMEIADLQGKPGRFFFDTFVWRRNQLCREFVLSLDRGQDRRTTDAVDKGQYLF